MRTLALCCTGALALASTALAQLDFSSPPSQLSFAAPPLQPHPGHLLQLAYDNHNDLATAVEALQEQGIDIWFAGKRAVGGQFSPRRWETLVRWPESDDELAPLDQAHAFLEAAGIAEPLHSNNLPSLDDHLASPSHSLSSARALSAATLSNLSSTPSALDSLADPIHDAYHPYDSIHEVLGQLEERYPDWVRVFSIGQSSEGREIWAAKVTNLSKVPPEAAAVHAKEEEDDDDDDDDDDDAIGPPPLVSLLHKKRHKHKRQRKLHFVVAGTQHAREWIAASTQLYLLHQLVAVGDEHGMQSEKQRAKLLNEVEFTFVPVVNPDGYVYSWETDRLWRKSRQPVGNDCLGIDLNRNWGFKFSPGSRPNPCSDSYPGRAAFESVELRALSDFLADKENGVDAFLDVHSFGQMLLYPYSYSCDARTADEENLAEAVLQMGKALKDVHGRQFETGSVCEVSLTSPGESVDWTYAVGKIRWSFATELRDGGVFGFLLPPSQIRPSGEEMSAALRSLTQFILDKEAGKR
ncbi:hypothetical protein JCM10207_004340 [Rhodosporidiobolus poonsookiae]